MAKKRTAATIAALALTIALPASAFAATTYTANETLVVSSTLAITGAPVSIDYGSGLGGASKTGQTLVVTGSTNNASGLTFRLAASNLTTGGGATIPSTARQFKASLATSPAPAGASILAYATKTAYSGTTTDFAQSTVPTTGLVVNVEPSLTIPADALAGTYTGQVTISVADRP